MTRMIEVDEDTLKTIKAYQKLLGIKSQKEALRSMVSGMNHPVDIHNLMKEP